MNEFLQAVENGDMLAARAAFDAEMKLRAIPAIEQVRREVVANIDYNENDGE